jgi:Leucine-rich repeat (LRR) protein
MRLPTLPSLQTLNLCGNLLTCLPVLTLPNLHTLILRQNHLTSLLPLSAATLPRL